MKSFHTTYQFRDFIEDFEGVCEMEEFSIIYKLLNYEMYFHEKENV